MNPRRKMLVLLSVSILIVLLLASPQFTGWFVDVLNIEVSVAPTSLACIGFIGAPTRVAPGDIVDFPFYIENCGNRVLNGSIYFAITGPGGAVVTDFNSSEYSLDVFEGFEQNFTWVASQTPGTYVALAKDNYTNETVQATASFVIVGPSFEQPPAGGPGPQALGVTNFSVEAPSSVRVYRGTNQTFLMRVINRGRAVTNLNVVMAGKDLVVRSLPETIPLLDAGSSVVFLVEVDASRAAYGSYQLLWNVLGGGINRSGYTIVSVVPPENETQCGESVSYYLGILDRLKEQINALASEGRNVTQAARIFDEATFDLMAAETYQQLGSYGECLDRIEQANARIERIVLELAQARTEPILVILPVVYQVFIWSLASALVIIVALFLSRKVAHYHRQRTKRNKLVLPKGWS